MRYALAIILTSYFSVAVQAQAGPAQVTQQVQQVECRDLSVPNNYLAPNETMINGKACRPAGTLDPTTGIPLSAATPVATTPAPTPTPTATATPTRAVPATAPSDGKTRVFVTDSQSWETRGGSSAGGNKNGWGASSWIAGGARPQTVEVIKTLNQKCSEITVTNNLERADFVLTLDHEGGKGLLAHRNKIAVFNKDGDDIYSNSTRELGNSVKDACAAMLSARR
jgi:hypothetical protein